ncbi:MAG: hypothetical protein ACE5EB_06480 [Thermodesulfobacteriota bacterium]
METPAKGGLRFKKILIIFLSLSALIVAVIILSTLLFIRSRSFTPFVEKTLTRSLGQVVEINSISLEGWHVITVKGLAIKEDGSTLATIERTEVVLSLSGLLGGRIDKVSIKSPVLFLKPPAARGPVKGGGRGAPPVFFKNITIEDGTVTVSTGREKKITLGPVNLSLDAVSKRKAELTGGVFLPAFGSRVALRAGLDMERLAVDHGRVDISSIELKNLSAGNFSLFKGSGITGSLKAGLDIRKKGDGLEAELEIEFKDLSAGLYKDKDHGTKPMQKASGVLRALFEMPGDFHGIDATLTLRAVTAPSGKVTRHKAVIKGAYTFKGGRLKIKEASLTSPGLGHLGLEGDFSGIASRDPSIKLSFKARDISLAGLARTVLKPLSIGPAGMEYGGVLKGSATAAGSFSKGIRWQSNFIAKGLLVNSGLSGVNLKKKPLTLSASGGYNRDGDILNIKSFKAGIKGVGPLMGGGSLKKISTGKPQMDLRIKGKDIPIGAAPGVLTGRAAQMLKGMYLKGRMGLGLTIKGPLSSPLVRGALSVEGERIKSGIVDIKNFLLRAPHMGYKDSTLGIKKIIVKAESAGVKRGGVKVYGARDILLRGGLAGNLKKRLFSAKGFLFQTEDIKEVAGEVSLDLNGPVKAHGEVGLTGLDIEKIWPLATKYLLKGGGLEATGKLEVHSTLDAAFTGKKAGLVKGTVDLGIKGGGFSTPDGMAAGDGLNLLASGNFSVTLPELSARFNINAGAKDFELLAGNFYGDFTKTPVSLSLKGDYSRADNSVKIDRSEIRMKEVGAVLIKGKISNPGALPEFDARISIKRLSNKKIFDLFIRDTFQESFPLLSGLVVDGITSMNISAKGNPGGFNAEGRLSLRDMNVGGTDEDEEGPSVLGLNLYLPVDISYPEAVPAGLDKNKKTGSLNIKKISWGAVNFHDLEAKPSIRRNSLIFKDDLLLSIFGGNLRLGNLLYKNLLSPERRLSLSIGVDNIDLKEASTALAIPAFNGRLSGTIPEAALTKGSLRTEGAITLNLFGGEMRIKEIAAENILSPAASFKSTVELKDIDMGKVTATFEFGHITGILQGYVRDLEIVNGQPEAFVIKMETVKRRGVSQRISTSALEKISILGTGGGASVLNRGIYRLFKEYRYEKMGFKGRLKNDKFLLIGIETEGDKGYIIKGGFLPPRVDVISYTQNISFKELVERLKRINIIGGGGGGGDGAPAGVE